MAIGKSSPVLFRRIASLRYGKTGHSPPESLATFCEPAT